MATTGNYIVRTVWFSLVRIIKVLFVRNKFDWSAFVQMNFVYLSVAALEISI